MERCLALTIGLLCAFYQTPIYGTENGNFTYNASSKTDIFTIQFFINAYNDGQFLSYNGKYNWIKYYYHMGRNYYLNHTGSELIEVIFLFNISLQILKYVGFF